MTKENQKRTEKSWLERIKEKLFGRESEEEKKQELIRKRLKALGYR